MIDFIERVGPWLGFVSLAVLVILALLYFQQARQIRRLRDWAGRAPERAAEVARELAEQGVAPDPGEAATGRLGRFFGSIGSGFGAIGDRIVDAYYAVDRRSPVDFRIVLGVLAVGAIAAAVLLLHPFGLLEDEPSAPASEPTERDRDRDRNQSPGGNSGGNSEAAIDPGAIEVAILNATETAVEGLAGKLADVVGEAGYEVGEVTNATTPYTESLVMYTSDQEDAGDQLAADLRPELGKLDVLEISDDIAEPAGEADVVLVIGQDDSGF